MKRLNLILAAALVAGCASGPGKAGVPESYTDLRQRDEALLAQGMIYYGHDNEEEAFDDMYYAFMADKKEMASAAAEAAGEFRKKVEGFSDQQREFLEYVFKDYADLADLANYAYKDSKVNLPDGWTDLGAGDPALVRIIEKHSASGLKCSLMAKGDRRALVFAGTDFPGSWRNLKQVMDFIVDAYEDVNGALNSDASQVKHASRLVDDLLQAGYVTKDNLEFVGHSLGGRLSSEMAVRYGCPAVLFNAAGVSPEVYERYEKARNSAGSGWRGYIVDVIAANDPLTCAQKYMSGASDPFVSAAANALSVDDKTMDNLLSLGLSAIESVAGKVPGGSDAVSVVKGFADKYGGVVDEYYESPF